MAVSLLPWWSEALLWLRCSLIPVVWVRSSTSHISVGYLFIVDFKLTNGHKNSGRKKTVNEIQFCLLCRPNYWAMQTTLKQASLWWYFLVFIVYSLWRHENNLQGHTRTDNYVILVVYKSIWERKKSCKHWNMKTGWVMFLSSCVNWLSFVTVICISFL